MKKIYSLTIAGLLAGAISAQQANKPLSQNVKAMPAKTIQFDKSKLQYKTNPKSNSTTGVWVNYGEIMDQVLGGGPGQTGPGVYNWNYLNTDSALYGNFGGTNSAIWMHNLGDVLDITSPHINSILGTNWDKYTAISIDSIGMLYAYTRQDTAIDTLIVTLYAGTSTTMPTYYFTGMAADYGSDTVYFKDIKYTYSTNSVNATGKVVYKFPLGDADTSSAGKIGYWKLPTAFAAAAGKKVGCSITFKPGFSYSLGSLADTLNSFNFASIEENGSGTFPTYTYCVPAQNNCDYNVSLTVTTGVRYNLDPNWNGLFIPSYAYTAPWAYEHHGIYYNVNATNVGIHENVENNFIVEQNIPNPFNGTSTIGYTLKKAANTVKLEIMDFSGRLVATQVENNVKPGYSSFTVEASKLAKGVYFYSLNVDGNRISKKMIVE